MCPGKHNDLLLQIKSVEQFQTSGLGTTLGSILWRDLGGVSL